MQSIPQLALAFVLASSATAFAQAAPADDAIVFQRSVVDPRSGATRQALFVTDPAGLTVTQVTAPPDGAGDADASWSPDGTRLAFVRYRNGLEGDLMVVDRAGTRLTRLTGPQRDEDNPVWGPGPLIAFESAQGDPYPDCLHTIGWPRQQQRERALFCAVEDDGDPTDVMSPTWSVDGASVYVATSHPVGRLQEVWYGDVMRVDIATGAAVRVARTTLNDQSEGVIAPDGRTALFGHPYNEHALTLLDLANGTSRTLSSGTSPVYSADGRRVAFVRSVLVGTIPDTQLVQQVFIADLAAGNVRQVTDQRDEHVRLATIDWSGDGTRVLVQHGREGDATQRLAILDLATAQLAPLTEGTATEGAWFDR